jgi:hypothetical protein
MVRGAREGGDSVDAVHVDPNPDYVTCPHCTRRFNESAGERHIPLCKDKVDTKRRASANASANASRTGSYAKEEALKKRMGYQVLWVDLAAYTTQQVKEVEPCNIIC